MLLNIYKVQGACSKFKSDISFLLSRLELGVQEKVDVDCSGSKNKCSSSGSISFKDDFNLSELSTMVD